MVALSLQQFDVLNENFAAQERKLRAFSGTIGRLQDELVRMIADLEWDRARLAGLQLNEQSLAVATDVTEVSDVTEASDAVATAEAVGAPETAAHVESLALSSEEIEALDALELELQASEQNAVSANDRATVEELFADQSKIQDAISVLKTSIETTPVSTGPVVASVIEDAPVVETIVAVETTPVVALAPVAVAAVQLDVKVPHKVIDLAARRRGRASMLSRSAAAVAALLMLAGSPIVVDDLMQSDFGARLSRLGACNIEAIASDRECAMLAWLSL